MLARRDFFAGLPCASRSIGAAMLTHLRFARSNPAGCATFLPGRAKKRRRKSSLHAAPAALHSKGTAFSSLPRRNAMKPGHLHQLPRSLACPAIASATADEDAPAGRL